MTVSSYITILLNIIGITLMKIYVIGGGTGGHLFPAIALGEELKARSYDAELITDSRCLGYLPKDLKLKTHILALGSMKSGLLAKFFMCFKMIFATAKMISIFIVHRPALVVGFGGYTSFPALLAARVLYIPIMLHEGNCFLGKVNKLFAAYAKKIALNFAETTNMPTNLKAKIIISGNPVRKEIEQIKVKRDFTSKTFKILITGGSQGAKIFSSIVPEALKIIHQQKPELKIDLVQQAGSEYYDNLKTIYKKTCHKFELAEFFKDIHKRYLNSDLVICRAGASTIAELIYLGQPAILIPFPFAAENHQFYNAKALVDKNASWYFEQASMSAADLAALILTLEADRSLLQEASNKLRELYIKSSSILADTVEEIIKS